MGFEQSLAAFPAAISGPREVMFSGNPHEVPVKQALLRTQLPTARSGSAQSAQRTLRCHKELEDDRVTAP